MRSILPVPARACGLLALLAVAGPAPARAGEDNAPIAIDVKTSLEGEKGLGRILSSAAVGDVDDTARDVARLLGELRWARVVSSSPEVEVLIESREREERRRTRDKKGNLTIDHRYRASASVEVDGVRHPIRVEQDFSEGPYSTRNDSDQFQKLAEKIVIEVGEVVRARLDQLRPDRPQAGFVHEAKYKFLFKGDGLEVKSVEPGSPAEAAGLQVKDRIRRINTEKGTDQMDGLARTWWTEEPGTRVTLEIERNKQRQTLELTLQPRRQWAGGGAAAPAAAPAKATAASSAPRAEAPAAAGGSARVDLRPGMTEAQVVRALGEPQQKVAFGARTVWRYEGFAVTFEGGKVVDVK